VHQTTGRSRGIKRQKDELQRRICRAVCAGEIMLLAAQAIFLGDWRSELP
jgi:hypothetical protein